MQMDEEVHLPLHLRQCAVAVVHLQCEITLRGGDGHHVVDQSTQVRQANLVQPVALGQQSGQSGEVGSHVTSSWAGHTVDEFWSAYPAPTSRPLELLMTMGG